MSKVGMFKNLYQKEMRCLAVDIGVTLGIIILMTVFAFSRGSLGHGYIVVPVFLMAGLAGFMPIISSFRIFSGEWNNNIIYLTLSLPVKGEMVLGSKMLAILTQYVLGTLLVALSGILLGFYMWPGFFQLLKLNYSYIPWGFYLSLYMLGIAFFTYLASLSFFSQILGRMVPRLQNLATFFIFLGLWWVIKKVDFYIAHILSLDKIFLLTPDKIWLNIFSWSFTILLIQGLLIFAAAVMVYNRKIEL
ncbi:hypothetical protein SAMN02745221_00165 [Thermosyntropha lipolytica DSM 11003]|uniref:ABC-2 family transporter protein n=1 Tax=Thermosyntropha lipolytica DSM 11003 TaxID=1123382 RepID=A0A1M5JNW8_9FIRM|nr:hypothetical protein [Thermosyntropha lipolytica]SHG42267.1 hypothetical protein SAMN02745221_00165 [Thermosyntropha lipolytica DSM 11003]